MQAFKPEFEYGTGPVPGRVIRYVAVAEHCKENPDQWVLVRDCPTPDAAWALMHKIKTGRSAAFRPAGTFTAYTQGTTVYTRYTGEED